MRRKLSLGLLALCLSCPAVLAASTGEQRKLAADASDTAWLQREVIDAGYPGARMLVLQNEHLIVDETLGFADVARSKPLQPDSIYRIYSMTKPVISAAVLKLVGEGHGALDDAIAKHLPELAALKVMGASGIGSKPKQPLTIRHLLTHTSGFPGDEGKAGRRRDAANLERSLSLEQYVKRLSKVPLESEPGTRYRYDSVSSEVLGRLVEVWSGESLPYYLHTELFLPLGMQDTSFEVPGGERARIVDLSRINGYGALTLSDEPTSLYPGTRPRPYFSAAGGLYSTGPDYLRFARMLMGRGSLDGYQFISSALVDEMFQDQLAAMGLERAYIDEKPGRGFGLGLSILLDPAAMNRAGAAGQAGWTGAASTYFVIDPVKQTIGILLLQHLPRERAGDFPRVSNAFYNRVQQVVKQ